VCAIVPSMPRRKWIPKHIYERSAHANSLPDGLWWFRPETKDSREVVRLYLKQVARGRAPDKTLKDDLFSWLGELTQPVKIGPRRKRYWTLPAYAIAHGLNRSTFLKRFREMAAIAARLYPERVPTERRRITAKLRRAIVVRYNEIVCIVRDGGRRDGALTDIFNEIAHNSPADYDFPSPHKIAIRALSLEFRLPLSRIGLICRKHHIL
jgi:hypothetical protein